MKRNYFLFFLIILPLVLNAQTGKGILFKRISEPGENAFSLLVPAGWQVSGGIQRINPINSGAANAIEAKLDFRVYNNSSFEKEIHWLPDIYYFDPSQSPAASMFPEGSRYNGMPVLKKRRASFFVRNNLIPYLHPNQGSLNFLSENEASGLENLLKQLDPVPGMGMSYDAYVCDYIYTENGKKYRERMLCVLVDMGPYTAGMWKNTNTVYFRAPVEEFGEAETWFNLISSSVILNSDWVKREVEGQIKRGQILANTMQEIQRIDREMQEAHAKTTAEINHQAFLNLTGQEDFINPYTGKTETGTNQWKNRWVDNLGNVLYTDSDHYNPNLDADLNMTGFKKSPVKNQ